MKKFLLILTLALFSVSIFAQRQGSMAGKARLGYQSEYKRVGMGFEGQYMITDDIRLAPEVTFYFPKNRTIGFDINLNANYVFDLPMGFSVYPIAGLNIANSRYSPNKEAKKLGFKSKGMTKFGFNLGAGGDYDLSSSNFLSLDFKYVFSNKDFFQFMFGYGFRF